MLERKRRDELKDCYNDLRESIPDTDLTERSATGLILAKAVEYIEQLKQEEQAYLAGIQVGRMCYHACTS